MAVEQRSPTLPAGYTLRRPTRDELPAIVALTHAADRHDFGDTDFNLASLEIEWSMPRFDPMTDAWVVEHDGRIVASTHFTRRPKMAPDAIGWVHPDHRGKGIGTLLVGLVEERTREIVFAPGAEEPKAVSQGSNVLTPGAAELLRSLGYRVDRTFWRMSIELGDEEPPESTWPDGIELRPMRLGTDDWAVNETVVTAFRDHWGSSPLPFEEWRQLRIYGNRLFDPELWLLAWQGDRLVGASLNLDEDGEAWVQTLGVLREARGKGLGKALLSESFRAFHRRGHRKVYLGVDSENATGATRLYESAGMAVDRRWLHWVKQLT